MPNRAQILDKCQKAIGAAYDAGRECNLEERASIAAARGMLHTVIRGLLSKRPTLNKQVRSALEDLHTTQQNYTIDKMVRDIADVCVTLEALENGSTRSNGARHMEARMFCQHLRNEFRDVSPN